MTATTSPLAPFPFIVLLIQLTSCSIQLIHDASQLIYAALKPICIVPFIAFGFTITTDELHSFSMQTHHHRSGSFLAQYLELAIDPWTFHHRHLRRLLLAGTQPKMADHTSQPELATKFID